MLCGLTVYANADKLVRSGLNDSIRPRIVDGQLLQNIANLDLTCLSHAVSAMAEDQRHSLEQTAANS